jgi:hypothetical protein
MITVTGCYKKSIECARASSKLAEALVIAEEKRQILQRVAAVQLGRPASSQPAPHLKPAGSTKEVPPEAGKKTEALVSGAGPSLRYEGAPHSLARDKSRCRSLKTFG